MAYIIISIFFLTALLVLIEDYLGKYRSVMYVSIGLLLILVAGLREIGIDPDSENYAKVYQQYYNTEALSESVEYSFIIISAILNFLTDDAHAIFLFYAAVGLILKFVAFRQYSERWFLPVLMYIAFYYELHEVTQIRTGILSGLFLLSIKPIADGNRWLALCLIILGTLFHMSGIVLLPLLFLNNNVLSYKKRWSWALLIFIGYFMYYGGMSILLSLSTNIPYIGSKLALYQKSVEIGMSVVSLNLFSPLQLFTLLLYIILLIFYDVIVVHNRYFPIMMKIFTIGIFCLPAFAIIPVLGERLNHLICIVDIILFSNIFYITKQAYIGKLMVIAIATILLNYGLIYIDFNFLWKISGQ